MKKKTTNDFIKQAIQIHGDKYNYQNVEYVNTHTKVTIECPVHGMFEMAPVAHLSQEQGCVKCSYINRGDQKRKTRDQFIIDANKVHNGKYDYSLVQYVNNRTPVNIRCSVHGTFSQTPSNHIHSSQGCPLCWKDRRPPGVGGYHQGYFDINPSMKVVPGILYVIEVESNTTPDHFIKIGITKNSIKKRYDRTRNGNKYLTRTVLYEISMPLYDAWKAEQIILTKLKKYQYFPNIEFAGKTECIKSNFIVFKQLDAIMDAYTLGNK